MSRARPPSPVNTISSQRFCLLLLNYFKQLNLYIFLLSHKHVGLLKMLRGNETVADIPESWVWWRVDFQSGPKVLNIARIANAVQVTI